VRCVARRDEHAVGCGAACVVGDVRPVVQRHGSVRREQVRGLGRRDVRHTHVHGSFYRLGVDGTPDDLLDLELRFKTNYSCDNEGDAMYHLMYPKKDMTGLFQKQGNFSLNNQNGADPICV
jgi:hypothetical protein